MSHATVLVLLPPEIDLSVVETWVEKAMAPYDENTEMERRIVMSQKDVEDMRAYYENMGDDPANKINYSRLNPDWNKHLVYDGRVEEWNSGRDPKPTDRINGKSIEHSTLYNPRSKWDWWTIGGRWSGFFRVKKDADEEDWVSTEMVEDDYRVTDIARYRAIDWSQGIDRTFAILDARLTQFGMDAEWIENGRLGWFATTIGAEMTEEEWQQRWDEIVHSVPDDAVLVLVDYHM